MILTILSIVIQSCILLVTLFFVVMLIRLINFCRLVALPRLLILEESFKRLDRHSYVESLSLKQAKKEKARIDFLINNFMENFSNILAGKISIILGGKKKKLGSLDDSNGKV